MTPVQEGGVAFGLMASALQLRAHGYPEKARDYALRVVEFTETNDKTHDDPRVLGWALWLLGRYDEAYVHHARLLALSPSWIVLRGEVGCLAALRGDRKEALEQAARIAETDKPYQNGAPEFMRGLIMAHLGDLDRTVDLIAAGFAAGGGYKEARVHYHVFLSPLLGHPPYEELVRPKG